MFFSFMRQVGSPNLRSTYTRVADSLLVDGHRSKVDIDQEEGNGSTIQKWMLTTCS